MKITVVFIVLTLISILSGIKFGFTDSHTPPLPFVISGVLLIIGTILMFVKRLFENNYSYIINLIFTTVNLFIILICLR